MARTPDRSCDRRSRPLRGPRGSWWLGGVFGFVVGIMSAVMSGLPALLTLPLAYALTLHAAQRRPRLFLFLGADRSWFMFLAVLCVAQGALYGRLWYGVLAQRRFAWQAGFFGMLAVNLASWWWALRGGL